MTPERLQEIQERATEFYSEDHTGQAPADAATSDVWELLEYIDLLHEDLRITRAERDAEKKKNMVEAKGNALPEGARTMPDGSIRLGNRDYLKRKDTK